LVQHVPQVSVTLLRIGHVIQEPVRNQAAEGGPPGVNQHMGYSCQVGFVSSPNLDLFVFRHGDLAHPATGLGEPNHLVAEETFWATTRPFSVIGLATNYDSDSVATLINNWKW
jgi:hypothetical protein